MGAKATAPISDAQLRKIWFEARQANISDDTLHDIVSMLFAKDSLKELTKQQAISLIDYLLGLSGAKPRRPGMMTDRQSWLVGDYQAKLGWSDRDLQGLIKKCCHVDHIRFLTAHNASGLIEALKNIHQRKDSGEAHSVN